MDDTPQDKRARRPAGRDHSPRRYDDAEEALDRIVEIYDHSRRQITAAFDEFRAGRPCAPPRDARYPYLAIRIGPADVNRDTRLAFGNLPDAGTFATTLTRPDLFRDYYREQIELLINNHGQPVSVGLSDHPMPLPYAVEDATAGVTPEDLMAMRSMFALPDMARIDDAIANGTYLVPPGEPRPLALFTAERVDYSLQRLTHYSGTSARYFQRFVLFTNYQRYVDEFIAYGRAQVANGEEYTAFVEPGDVLTPSAYLPRACASGRAPEHMPQMPAYHLVRDGHDGITLVNIGVGPANAKTITDHLAVIRPHCWLMVGHCGGLRRTQRLGDYVLAHAYCREDHVLDEDVPPSVPVPPIAEIQVALSAAVTEVTGLSGRDLKLRLRTGTVYTTDDRNWELRHTELTKRFNQSRAIAVDMESATIAANGFRLRVPYGTLLCVSDKPLHGEIKLRGMADAFYRERVSQHLEIGIETLRALRAAGTEALHSRKLRSFDEPAFR